ncbi:retrovirus-related pol polyprotein from transposon TNT 1-94 [Tanacetum coccineum]|uniref:Retrovirus-related pol polyprotein from transposon TNT 1-94 n=1 Tax=Tanacetum coccineum TaxID=301880 RepID=A0ABQ5AQY3_9ASTR
MCDKKNSVLFTDTACPDFKLTDESHVSLKVPRKDNMYSVDLKNVVPQGGLTCLFEKATLDESNLWHRRLGHDILEAARTMLADSKVPITFWAEAVNTACYVQNRVLVIKPYNKTPYELFLGRKPALNFKRPFGYPVTILNTIDHLGSGPNWIFDIDALTKSMNYKSVVAGNQSNGSTGTKACDNAGILLDAGFKPFKGGEKKMLNESKGNKSRNPTEGKDSEVPSTEEPKINQEKDDNINNTNNINTASDGNSTNNVNVVSSTVNAAGSEVNAMDVKSAFLYGKIEEEVYVCQPPGFEDPDFSDKVYKVEKALYGLHQTPIAWDKGDILLVQILQVNPKSSHLHAMKKIFRYLKGQPKLGLWYPKDSPFDLVAYTNSDYAGASLDRKSTTGVKNPVFYSKIKHIEIRHHFIRDSNKKKLIQIIKIHTDQNVTDLLTKASDVSIFQYLIASITYYCWVYCGATAGSVNAVRLNLVLLVQVNVVEGDFINTLMSNYGLPAKVKTVNGEVQIQALVDKKKVIITETSVRSDLQLEDADGAELLRLLLGMNLVALWPLMSSVLPQTKNLTFPMFLDKQVEGMSKHKEIYVTPSHTKKVFANMKRQGKDFSGRDTPLFPTMIVQAQEQKKQSRRKQRKDTEDSQLSGPTEPVTDDTENVQSVTTHSNDPLLSAAQITELKKRVKKLEGKRKSKPPGMKRLFKIGRYAQVVSSKDEGLGDQEDASKQGRKIDEINQDLRDMAEKEVDMAEKDVSTANPVTTAGEVVTTVNVVVTNDSITTTTVDELTLAQTLIEIKAAKPKGRGVIVQEPSKMVEPEKPLKKKNQIMFDKEITQKLQAQLDAELEEEDKLARQREEDANIDFSGTDTPLFSTMIVQVQEQKGEGSVMPTVPPTHTPTINFSKFWKRCLWNLWIKGRIIFQRIIFHKFWKIILPFIHNFSTYLKNMAGYKHNQLKTKSFEDIQMLFDKAMTRVNTFVDMDTELVKGSETRTEGSSKRAGEELESENLKKQKLDENVEAEVDDEAEMKKHMEIVPDDEVAIDAIPLATKPPIIVDWKIIKEGKMGYFQIIRADGSSRRYSSMIKMLQNIDREDLETLWKLVKAKHGLTRPEEAYERVLWGDLKVMFEPDVESEVWRNLQGHKVTVWKLFSSSGVHFVRFQNLHIFMLVEKKYPLTPATITEMLNKKLQADH